MSQLSRHTRGPKHIRKIINLATCHKKLLPDIFGCVYVMCFDIDLLHSMFNVLFQIRNKIQLSFKLKYSWQYRANQNVDFRVAWLVFSHVISWLLRAHVSRLILCADLIFVYGIHLACRVFKLFYVTYIFYFRKVVIQSYDLFLYEYVWCYLT